MKYFFLISALLSTSHGFAMWGPNWRMNCRASIEWVYRSPEGVESTKTRRDDCLTCQEAKELFLLARLATDEFVGGERVRELVVTRGWNNTSRFRDLDPMVAARKLEEVWGGPITFDNNRPIIDALAKDLLIQKNKSKK